MNGNFAPLLGATTDFTHVEGNWSSFDLYPRQLADVTGDGLADIVGFGESRVYTAQANGDGTFAPLLEATTDFTHVEGNWSSFDSYPRQLADVTGDGLADIVAFGESRVYTAQANGDGTFAPLLEATTDFTHVEGNWSSFDSYPRQLADVTGDGLADIIAFGESQVYIAQANGDGTKGSLEVALGNGFTHVEGNWSSFDSFPRQLADVTGDGLADIVGFGVSEVYTSLGV